MPPVRRPPEEALPEPGIGVSQAVGASAAGATVTTVAGSAAGAAGTAPAVPLLKLAQETVEEIVDALTSFRVVAAAREDEWILRKLRRLPGITQQDILDVIADERARRAEFDQAVLGRVRRDAQRAFELPDKGARKSALEALVRRERRYAGQRSRAVAERSLALADRVVLQRESPQGAYWDFVEDERVTPDCRAMGGRVWPWPVLLRFHPPTHTGCRCKLRSYAWARARGLVSPRDLLDVDEAMKLAAAAAALLHEDGETVDALVDVGVVTEREAWRALLRTRVAA